MKVMKNAFPTLVLPTFLPIQIQLLENEDPKNPKIDPLP
jgi:hypothetical protein